MLAENLGAAAAWHFCLRKGCHINARHVHGNAADNGAALAAYKHLGRSIFLARAQLAGNAIAITCPQNGDAAVARGFPRGTIANGFTLLHLTHLQNRARKRGHGFHRVLFSRRWISAIECNAGAHQIIGKVPAQKYAGGIGKACGHIGKFGAGLTEAL